MVITGLTRNQVIPHGTEGSNPSLSALYKQKTAQVPTIRYCAVFVFLDVWGSLSLQLIADDIILNLMHNLEKWY